ncbi:MAG: sigma-70 family RNA polymerase sigma factor [Anaerolineae bacterium]
MSLETAQTFSTLIAQEEVSIMRAARADPTHFALIYERYFPRIYAYCLRQIGNAEEAEDMASLVFFQAFKNVQQYRGGSVTAWLFRIAYGTVMNHLRKTRYSTVSIEERVPEIASQEPEPLEEIVHAETQEIIRTLINSLSADDQHLLSLKIDAGLNSQEIGELLDLSPNAVRTRLHRIIKRLREQYRQTEKRK